MTGTSINPLLRAAYLARERPAGKVTLMVPWLEAHDQKQLKFSKIYESPEAQKRDMHVWLEEAGLEAVVNKLEIKFYTGRYHDEYCSIFPMGDIADVIPDAEADVCILEEPEHLNWFRAPFATKAWTEKFKHVVGIIHTNYLVYTRSHQGGGGLGGAFGDVFKEPIMYYVNQGMCRAYTHKVIKLSNALQEFAPEKEVTCNVHGVRERYLLEGDLSATRGFSEGAYFVGKLSWPKGLDLLFDYMTKVKESSGKCFHVDIFGSGPHEAEIKAAAVKSDLSATFHGPVDHSMLSQYKVFVNPSLSEVLCTTVIEALAMGKWAVVPRHPSNEFFYQFPNCLMYTTPGEFAANVDWALNNDPRPLSPELRHELTWEAATERLIDACCLTVDMQQNTKVVADKFSRWLHDMMGTGAVGDTLRALAGAKGASKQAEFVKKYGSTDPTSRSSDTLAELAASYELEQKQEDELKRQQQNEQQKKKKDLQEEEDEECEVDEDGYAKESPLKKLLGGLEKAIGSGRNWAGGGGDASAPIRGNVSVSSPLDEIVDNSNSRENAQVSK